MDDIKKKTVLVIGGGLAGITAALAAVKNAAQVTLVTSGPGTFALSGGTVSVQGMSKEASYLQEAIEFFQDMTAAAGCEYEGSWQERTLIPNIMGGLQEVVLAPFSLWAGKPVNGNKVKVVGLRGLSGFSASLTAELLTAAVKELGMQVQYSAAEIKVPWLHNCSFTSLDIANYLEDEQKQEQLVKLIKPLAREQDLLLLPAVFGSKLGRQELAKVSKLVGCSVGELITVPPSMVGLRVFQAMWKYLQQTGVDIISGYPAQILQIDKGVCTAVFMDTPGRKHMVKAQSIIVATGRVNKINIAIKTTDGTADCFLPGNCLVNESMQLIAEKDVPFAANVYGAGSILETNECKNGNALAILTGYRAGILAAKGGS